MNLQWPSTSTNWIEVTSTVSTWLNKSEHSVIHYDAFTFLNNSVWFSNNIWAWTTDYRIYFQDWDPNILIFHMDNKYWNWVLVNVTIYYTKTAE